MKIKKYIKSKGLPKFQSTIDYLYDCEYCNQNYCEEGNKTDCEIHLEHINNALNVQQNLGDVDLEVINELQELINLLAVNQIDFIKH